MWKGWGYKDIIIKKKFIIVGTKKNISMKKIIVPKKICMSSSIA